MHTIKNTSISGKAAVLLSSLFLSVLLFSSCGGDDKGATSNSKYSYETVEGDPMKTRIYTLDNGLKVYLSEYDAAPRVQTYIAVRAGSKNDPEDATGLAHYLEHMLFKGTDKFGSLNYEKEKPLLDTIEILFEEYRQLTDETERNEKYRVIDSISGVAATYAIANEYDKMVGAIGAQGTNAYTSFEQTVYVNDIPSNQIENWLRLEGERFRNPAMRIFHTELEAVYEEKNRALDSDGDKQWETLFASLWKKHGYGTKTTIGTIDHLKNPSITEIKKYFKANYVPNNMAICMSGDFDSDEVIKNVDKYFGSMETKEVVEYTFEKEDPITKPRVEEVFGPDAESLMMGFRIPEGSGSNSASLMLMVDGILNNGVAGLLDLNVNQQQKALGTSAYPMRLRDYSTHLFWGYPKQGQSLVEVKDLILEQLEKVKKGEFDEWLLSAIINDLKLNRVKELESNARRASLMVDAFCEDLPWKKTINEYNDLEHITKEEIVKFANEIYDTNAYAIVYKRTGEDKNVQKVTKPAITPVELNREAQSPFLKEITEAKVKDIEPVFIDYNTDIKKGKLKMDIPLLYAKNDENDRFKLFYRVDIGEYHDKKLSFAVNYLDYLGTDELTPAEVKQELFKLGCSFSVNVGSEDAYISLSGLDENFDASVRLFEKILANATPNEEALKNLVSDELKVRADNKLNKDIILRNALYPYAKFGENSPFKYILSTEELNALEPAELIDRIKSLCTYPHKVIYYGPRMINEVEGFLNENHKLPQTFAQTPEKVKFEEQPTGGKVYVVDYDMKQAECILFSKLEFFNATLYPEVSLFNNYFGGGMSSVVFQEIRESKALAYSAFSTFTIPSRKDRSHYMYSYVGTQADKLKEALSGMKEIIENLPMVEGSFKASQEATLQKIRSNRIRNTGMIFSYLAAEKLGVDHDVRKDIFDGVSKMDTAALRQFHKENVKGNDHTLLVIGKKSELDMETLKEYGEVRFVTLEEIFGY